jgi:hypothetical protein
LGRVYEYTALVIPNLRKSDSLGCIPQPLLLAISDYPDNDG